MRRLARRLRRALRPRKLLPWSGAGVLGAWLALAFSGLALWREARPGDLPFLDALENAALRWKFQARGFLRPGPDVVVATIDEPSIERFGRWPWSRDVFARLVRRLREAGARTVAFDVIFDKPDRPAGREAARRLLRALEQKRLLRATPERAAVEALAADDTDAHFAEAIRSAGNVILGFFLYSTSGEVASFSEADLAAWRARVEDAGARVVRGAPASDEERLARAAGVRAPIEPLARAAGRWKGYFNYDPAGHVTLAMEVDDAVFYHFAVLAAAHFSGDYPVLRYRPRQPPQVVLNERGIAIPSEVGGRFYPNYYGPKNTFKHFSVSDIIDGVVPPERLRGKLVFVGSTAIAAYDLRPTPFDSTFPGVEIAATVADNILTGRFLTRPLEITAVEVGVLLLLGPLLGLVLSRAPLWLGLGIALGVLAGVGAADVQLFREGYLAHSTLVYGEILVGILAIYALLYFKVYKERKRLKSAMQHYLAPSVLSEILRDQSKLKLGGEKRELTILFSDIRGFTALAESFDARELVAFLNEYFTPMTDVVLRHQGTFDKYMGDAIMAFFGAPQEMPDHAVHACRAALDMRAQLRRLNERWRARGLPEIDIGIGLNSGVAAFGNMGSARLFDYTVVGDNVNLASRVEATSKLFGVPIVVTGSTARAAQAELLFRRLGAVFVPGKAEPVQLHELLGTRRDEDALRPWIAAFEEALARFETRDLDGAAAAFARVLELRPDPAARAYLERIERERQDPAWEPCWRAGK